MSEPSENLIESETNSNENDDIPAKLKGEETFKLIEQEKIEVSENGLETEPEDEKSEWEDLLGSGSLMKKVVRKGKEDGRPQRLERCVINYECTLEDGTLVEKKDNFEMLLGDCEVIQGLDLAIGLMNVGEKCELKIQPRLAYGAKGLEPNVPPDAAVYYSVELISVEPEEDMENLSIEERKIRGNKKRERGNWWYGRGENTLAIQCYRRALDYLDEVEGGIKDIKPDSQEDVTDAALQDLLEDRLSVSNNMAAAQIKMGHYDAALNSLQTVLRCQPGNIKALYRKAKIHREKNDLSAALKCLQKAYSISPNNQDIQKEMASINALMQKQKVSERELARRMFNGPKASVSEEKGKKSPSKFVLWTTIASSVLVAAVGLIAYRLKFT